MLFYPVAKNYINLPQKQNILSGIAVRKDANLTLFSHKDYKYLSKDSEKKLEVEEKILNGKLVVSGFSTPLGEKCINFLFKDSKGYPIVCRQISAKICGITGKLADGILQKSHEINKNFSNIVMTALKKDSKSLDGIQGAEDLAVNEYDANRIGFNASEYVPFSLDKKDNGVPDLREQIIAIIYTMKLGEKQRLLLFSEKHSMKLQISIKKNGIIKIRFCNPDFNFNIEMEKMPDYVLMLSQEILEKIKNNLLGLQNHINRNIYFKSGHKIGILARYGEIKHLNQEIYTQDIHELKNLIYFQLSMGFDLEKLRGRCDEFFDLVINNNFMTDEKKLDFLQMKNAYGYPGLYLAVQNDLPGAVKVLVEVILNHRQLSEEQKLELLQGRSEGGYPALYVALACGFKDVVKVLVEAVLSHEQFSRKQKLEFLQAKDSDGYFGLYMTIDNGHPDTAKVFVESVFYYDEYQAFFQEVFMKIYAPGLFGGRVGRLNEKDFKLERVIKFAQEGSSNSATAKALKKLGIKF